MANSMMGTSIEFLPEDILIDILKRLPPQSIFQCQCVCKPWKNLINNPTFIADHLKYSSHQNPLLLLQRCNFARYDQMRLSLLNCSLEVIEVQNAPLIDPLLMVCVISSCNGLLCLEMHTDGISPDSLLLWNPTIREVREMPRTIDDFVGDCFSGFGFSPRVNDYKIVRVYVPGYYDYKVIAGVTGKRGTLRMYETVFVNRVEVYSLRRGLWREVGFDNLEGVRFDSDAVTIKGAVVWIGSKNDAKLIISFDIAKEVFTVIPMPALHPNSDELKLTEYENKLAVLAPIMTWGNPDTTSIDMWVMEQGTGAPRERWSWTRHTVGPNDYKLVPVTIWRDKIISYVQYGSDISDIEGDGENDGDGPKHVLSRSNVATDEYSKFGTRRCGYAYSNSIFNHVETLVSVYPCGRWNYGKSLMSVARAMSNSSLALKLFCLHCIFSLCQHFL